MKCIKNEEMNCIRDAIDRLKLVEKALDKACEKIVHYTYDCPNDYCFGGWKFCKKEKCKNNLKECWKEYLLKESEKENGK